MTNKAAIDKDPRREKSAADARYLQRVGDRVRASRDVLGMTRKSLSSASGVSERYLADLEAGAGNASLLVLRRIATALRVDMDVLLSSDPDPSPDILAIEALLPQLSAAALTALRDRLENGRSAVSRQGTRRIALIGLRGAGKSTIGRAAADALAVPFVELDREIERAAGMELSEIFALKGKAIYRQHELRCLKAIISHYEHVVIATGGSLVTEPEAFDLLLENCHVVWLKADPKSHMERVMAQGDLRPMANNPKAMDDLQAILEQRRPLYARAHASVDTNATTHGDAVDAVLKTLPPS